MSRTLMKDGRPRSIFSMITMVVLVVLWTVPTLGLLGPEGLGISGQYIAVWLLHTGFGMPLALYTLRNYMATLPVSVVESAKVDGCSHYQTFWKLVAPMAVPAMAAFATLQFLWVWNDLLVSLVFLGGTPDVAPITVRVAELSGSRGSAWYLLSAGAFISMIVPVAVFLALQRYFVRGLLAGGLKG